MKANKDKYNILFVCHGNICRSPMGEFMLKEMVRRRGCAGRFRIASAATSYEEIGNGIYPPARRCLHAHGIPFDTDKTARRLTPGDYEAYDLLIGMDYANIRNMTRICGGDPDGKIHLMMEYAGPSGRGGHAAVPEVADPWYTGDFEITYRNITDGCEGLLEALEIVADA